MNDLIEALVAACGVFVLLVAWVVRPPMARCPTDWHNNGIDPRGRFTCTPAPVGDPDYDGVFGRPDRSVQPPGVLRGRITCTGGAHPIVVDARTVGCQR